MMSPFILLLLLCSSACTAGFLDVYHSSFVEQLDPINFDERVMQHTGVVLVQFYTPWSPNCKKIAPVWIEAAEVLRSQGSSARLAMIDADEHREFSRRFKIGGYPTIVSFGPFTKELPEYVLDGEPSMHVDDVVQHVKDLESVTKLEAEQRLKDVQATKAKGKIPTNGDGASEPPAKKNVLRNEDGATTPNKSTKKKKHTKDKKESPGRDSKARRTDGVPFKVHQDNEGQTPPLPEDSDFGGRVRQPRRPRAVPDDGERPHTPEFPHPRMPTFDPIRPEATDDWEERRKNAPPPSPEDDARHAKMVEEHWERVRQRKEERDARRMRGESNEHDEIYHRHEQVIADARRRHDDHMAGVMKRHEDAMADVRRRIDAHRLSMDQQFGRVGGGGEEATTSAPAAVEDDATGAE